MRRTIVLVIHILWSICFIYSYEDTSLKCTINDNNVNLRNEPSLTSLIIRKLSSETIVNVHSRSINKQIINGETYYWYLIAVDSDFGWVYGKYVSGLTSDYLVSSTSFLDTQSKRVICELGAYKYSIDLNKYNHINIGDDTYFFSSFSNNVFTKYCPPGLYIFTKTGKFKTHYYKPNFLNPGNIGASSPSETAFIISTGTSAIGRGLIIMQVIPLTIITEIGQASSSVVWVSEEEFLYSRFFGREKRNIPSEDNNFIGISKYNIWTNDNTWIMTPNENTNFYIESYSKGILSYSAETFSNESNSFNRKQQRKTMSVK